MVEYIDRHKAILALLDSPTTIGGMTLASDALKRLSDVPISDVAPVVHGSWETHIMPLAYKCSICGYKPSAKEWRFHKRNFCPNCGAKMIT